MNVIGILETPDESLEKGRNVVSILWPLDIFYSILDSHKIPSFSIWLENGFDAEYILNLPDDGQMKPCPKRSS